MVENMMNAERSFRGYMIFYPPILMLRFFKSFAAQPRLAIVTDTFKTASEDLFHFSIVFFSVFICMTVMGVLFFGQDHMDFATFDRAMHAAFQAIFGVWDWPAMERVTRVQAIIWFWPFIIVMVLILFNMLVAIIMDAYGHVKEAAGEAPTLIAQVQNMIRRHKQNRRKERVTLAHIYESLLALNDHDDAKMLSDESIIFPGYLLEVVEGIKQEQVDRTMNNAKDDYERTTREPFTIDNVKEHLESINERIGHTAMAAGWVDAKMEQYEAMQPPPAQDEMDTLPTAANAAVERDEGLTRVCQVAHDRVEEVSSGVASILGEEMRGLERRQKEQQRAMSQMLASLTGLKSLVTKLNQTSADVASLSMQVAEDDDALGREPVPGHAASFSRPPPPPQGAFARR